MGGAERQVAARLPPRLARPPVGSHRSAAQGFDHDAPMTSGDSGAHRVVEHRPLAGTKQALLGTRPPDGLVFRGCVLPAEASLEGCVDQQVGRCPHPTVGHENVVRATEWVGHAQASDRTPVAVAVGLVGERQGVAVRSCGSLSVAALGLTPCGLDGETGLALDLLSNLDAVTAERPLLLPCVPAAELDGAVGKKVGPAPVRRRQECRRRPGAVFAAGCLTDQDPTRERVSRGDLNV